MASAPAKKRDSYARYIWCAKTLADANGRLTESTARNLMKAVQQKHTQWTGIYDLGAGTLGVFTGGDDARIHRVRI